MSEPGPRGRALALAVLATVAVVAGVGLVSSQGSAPTGQMAPPEEVTETTNRLPLEGAEHRGYQAVTPDLGSALMARDDTLRADHEQYVLLEHEFSAVPVDERQTLVQRWYDRILERIQILERRESEAVSAHAAGETSDVQLILTLHRVATEAAYLETALDEVADRSRQSPGISISATQIRDDKSRLDLFRTPVSDRIDATLRGVALTDETMVTIRTTDTGYHLATVDEGTYLLETTRFDNRDESRPNQFDRITDAFDHATSLYPWASEHSSSPAVNERTSAKLYWIQFPHPQGSLEAYLDAGTGEIFREVQQLSLDALPSQLAGGPWTGDDLVLSINETPADGPIRVTVREVQTAEPVPATIAVDETRVTETGEDGTAWIVPPGGQYDVTATSGNRTVTTAQPD